MMSGLPRKEGVVNDLSSGCTETQTTIANDKIDI